MSVRRFAATAVARDLLTCGAQLITAADSATNVAERGLPSPQNDGQALAEIRDQRLYRRTHGTFEEYCRERWGFDRNRASQMISAAEVVNDLDYHGNQDQLPTNERQARELGRVPEERRPEVWERTLDRTLRNDTPCFTCSCGS